LAICRTNSEHFRVRFDEQDCSYDEEKAMKTRIGSEPKSSQPPARASGPLADALGQGGWDNSSTLPTAIEENIRQLVAKHEDTERRKTLQVRIADAITRFSGSMAFVWLHVVWFGVWIVLNGGWLPGYEGFDPFPFGLLTMIVSLEAIFLSTFVLISQNRMQAAADRRSELDLHINLLSEREATLILTKLARIEEKLGVEVSDEEARVVDELTQETNPREVVDHLEKTVLIQSDANGAAPSP
jgi:uncharacterized membrane protein